MIVMTIIIHSDNNSNCLWCCCHAIHSLWEFTQHNQFIDEGWPTARWPTDSDNTFGM